MRRNNCTAYYPQLHAPRFAREHGQLGETPNTWRFAIFYPEYSSWGAEGRLAGHKQGPAQLASGSGTQERPGTPGTSFSIFLPRHFGIRLLQRLEKGRAPRGESFKRNQLAEEGPVVDRHWERQLSPLSSLTRRLLSAVIQPRLEPSKSTQVSQLFVGAGLGFPCGSSVAAAQNLSGEPDGPSVLGVAEIHRAQRPQRGGSLDLLPSFAAIRSAKNGPGPAHGPTALRVQEEKVSRVCDVPLVCLVQVCPPSPE